MFEAEIARGVKLLDAKVPGWREKIDRDQLSMGDGCNCILGQIYGHFDEGIDELDSEDEAAERGFDSEHDPISWEELTREWLDGPLAEDQEAAG